MIQHTADDGGARAKASHEDVEGFPRESVLASSSNNSFSHTSNQHHSQSGYCSDRYITCRHRIQPKNKEFGFCGT